MKRTVKIDTSLLRALLGFAQYCAKQNTTAGRSNGEDWPYIEQDVLEVLAAADQPAR